MTFNELQKTWQKNEGFSKLTIDSDLFLREVKRNRESFASIILSRDVLEILVGILVILFIWSFAGFLFYQGLTLVAWASLLMSTFFLWVILFFIIDRAIQRKKRAASCETLIEYAKDSLAQVNHQIWLLKNVFWWYLLPPVIGLVIFFSACAWQTIPCHGKISLIRLFLRLTLVAIVSFGVYCLNQWAVRKDLNPRKNELESRLKTLTGNGSGS